MNKKTILLIVAVVGMSVSLVGLQWNLGTFRSVSTGFVLGYLVCMLAHIFSPRRR